MIFLILVLIFLILLAFDIYDVGFDMDAIGFYIENIAFLYSLYWQWWSFRSAVAQLLVWKGLNSEVRVQSHMIFCLIHPKPLDSYENSQSHNNIETIFVTFASTLGNGEWTLIV